LWITEDKINRRKSIINPKNEKSEMKKVRIFVLIILFISCGGREQNKVERTVENGVEVILNHIEPYTISGEPTTFNLEEIFTIDTENFSIARAGLTDISCFDVDSNANIYFLEFLPREGDNIFKFDKNGRFVNSFGRTGQGPGEVQYPYHLDIDDQDNIVVTDQSKQKLIFFNKDGNSIKETPLDLGIAFVSCLENGKFLTFGQLIDGSMSSGYIHHSLRLVNSQFEEVKELNRLEWIPAIRTKRRKGTPRLWGWSVSKRNIFVGNEERGYEIWVYDLDGNLIRKIKKEYKKVPISEEYKKKRLESMPGIFKKITFFPDYFPPYQSFFTDDRGRLFVMTYEKGANPDEFITDIFSNEGVFVGRKSLNAWVWNSLLWAKIEKNFLYCLQEKENGYKKLVVFKLTWK
jgi:hypothetical protein